MSSRRLIKESLWLLHINGLNPNKTSFLTKLNMYVFLVAISSFPTEMLMEVIWNWKGLQSMEAMSELFGLGQIMLRFVTMVVYRKTLKQTIDHMDKYFCPLHKYGKKFQAESGHFFDAVQKVIIGFCFAMLVTAVVYCGKPMVFRKRELPFLTYHPVDRNNSPDYQIAYAFHTLIVLKVNVPLFLGFDILFISLIAHIINEFRLIRHQFELLAKIENGNDIDSQLVEIGQQHAVVLRCIRYMKTIYSNFLLSQLFSTMLMVCMALVTIVASGFPPDIGVLMQVTSYFITFTGFQMMYCIAGAYLTYESQSVADAAYKIKWWTKTQPKLRRSTALIILRAQKLESLAAGGMIDLNLQTFGNLMKNAYSFFMVINTAFKNNLPK